MEKSDLPTSAKFARKTLKLIALPLVVLAVAVRFTVAPSTWWIDGVFLGVCLFAILLAIVGKVFTVK